MKLIYGNLFDPASYQDESGQLLNIKADIICITTNGYIKQDGCCVMGRGCAKEAADRWPNVPRVLGKKIQTQGNVVQAIDRIYIAPGYETILFSFPVKPVSDRCGPHSWNVVKHMRTKFTLGDEVPGWACLANLELIRESAIVLQKLVPSNTNVILPRPGTGAGELDWNEVKSILERYLDDRFYCITFPLRC